MHTASRQQGCAQNDVLHVYDVLYVLVAAHVFLLAICTGQWCLAMLVLTTDGPAFFVSMGKKLFGSCLLQRYNPQETATMSRHAQWLCWQFCAMQLADNQNQALLWY